MGEALIVGRGGGSSGGSGKLKTEIITSNTVWSVPAAKDQLFSVRIFGGGGAGGVYNSVSEVCVGGGGGFMNNSMLNLAQGLSISINIGRGGNSVFELNSGDISTSGGTTFFGSYLSAAGGQAGRFGGNGGSGGGGAGYTKETAKCGGVGFQFGGGGGTYMCPSIYSIYGYGGKWGGGGGAYIQLGKSFKTIFGGCLTNPTNPGVYNNVSNPGQYRSGLAGNSASYNYESEIFTDATNGTNTIGNNNIFNGYIGSGFNVYNEDTCAGNLQGAGKVGETKFIYANNKIATNASSYAAASSGGGGYGGNGGNNCGGGGGYGANGGGGFANANYFYTGGGGGGYGGDGGFGSRISDYFYLGGGGGGYGRLSGSGGNASNAIESTAYIGGIAAGGGGITIYNGVRNTIEFFDAQSGGNGICIIQYYEV